MGFSYYNPNPSGKSVGDCTVRAIAKALDRSWEETYTGLALKGFCLGDMPNADSVWDLTVHDFVLDHPQGTYILSMPGRHVLCVQDGTVYDSWNSGGEVPVYYWTKEC